MDTPPPTATRPRPPAGPTDDFERMDAARAGDQAALGQLLQHHERRVHNLCLRMVNQADDAAELTQDTLMKAVQKLPGFRGDSTFGTWLTRVAMNTCLSHLRKRKLRRTTSLDAEAPGPSSQRLSDRLAQTREPDVFSRVEHQDRLQQLYAALATLDPDHRAVLVLRDLDQMDYTQIAQTLDLPPGTVKSRLFRARLALRERMNPASLADRA